MKKNVKYIVALFVWGLLTATSQAQFGTNTGGGRPAVSPYLNINRPGDTAINYYGLVRPQVAAAKAFATLGNDFTALEAAANQPAQTGHASSFMTQGRYFMTNGAGTRGGQAGAQQKK
jgi:hypothetical protein